MLNCKFKTINGYHFISLVGRLDGIGGLSDAHDHEQMLGVMVAFPRLVGICPADKSGVSDHLFCLSEEENTISMGRVVSFSGDPTLFAHVSCETSQSLRSLLSKCYEYLKNIRHLSLPLLTFIAEVTALNGTIARLEPIFKFEMTHIKDREAVRQLLIFEEWLAGADSLGDPLILQYNGHDPMVKRAFDIMQRLKEYATMVTIFEYSLVRYLLPVLEWTYPVVCYGDSQPLMKEYAIMSAALISEQLEQIEQKEA